MGAYDDYFDAGFVGAGVSPSGQVVRPQAALSYDLVQQIQQTGRPGPKTLAKLQELNTAEEARATPIPKAQLEALDFASTPAGMAGDPDLPALRQSVLQERNRLNMMRLGTLDAVKDRFLTDIQLPEGNEEADKKTGTAIRSWMNNRISQLVDSGYGKNSAYSQAVAEARLAFPHISQQSLVGAIPTSKMELYDSAPFYGVEVGPQRAVKLSKKRQLEIINDPEFEDIYQEAVKYKSLAGDAGNVKGYLTHMSSGWQAADVKPSQAISSYAQELSLAAALVGLY